MEPRLKKKQNVLQFLQNVLARSNVLENIHEAKLLQPITANIVT